MSPTGKWLAFASDESGRSEVYVRPFPTASDPKRRWQVSQGGGGMPRWRADGNELYFLTAGGRMLQVGVRGLGTNFEFDPPKMLFPTLANPANWNSFDVTPDGQHFLLNLPLEWPRSLPITVVTNWTGRLKE